MSIRKAPTQCFKLLGQHYLPFKNQIRHKLIENDIFCGVELTNWRLTSNYWLLLQSTGNVMGGKVMYRTLKVILKSLSHQKNLPGRQFTLTPSIFSNVSAFPCIRSPTKILFRLRHYLEPISEKIRLLEGMKGVLKYQNF